MNTNIPDSPPNNIDKPFIHSEELTLFDKWSIGIYLLMTILVATSYDLIDVGSAHIIILIYAWILQLCTYFFLYRSLRNFRCYLIWFGFSMVHLAMYFLMRNDQRLQSVQHSPVALLRNTFVLLLFFQVLRYISLKTQHMELVMISKTSNTDDLDHRNIMRIDRALFLAYFAAFGALAYFSFPH
jgi:hypothetical protein